MIPIIIYAFNSSVNINDALIIYNKLYNTILIVDTP